MTKKVFSLLFIIFTASTIFCTSVFAATKNDIISFVNAQSVCGDTGLFNSYKKTFTRLLKQKDLSASELNTIYSYLQNAVGILNSKGVCKIADLSKLTSAEKKSVYNSLMAGANIITNAPMLEEKEEVVAPETPENNEQDKDKGNTGNTTKPTTKPNSNKNNTNKNNTSKENEGTKITINTQDGTMDIYENGVLVDKLEMSNAKMTYTGANMTYVLISVICIAVFGVSLLVFVKLYDIHSSKTRMVKNIFVSGMICSATILLVVLVFGSKIESALATINMLSISNSKEEIQVELNDKHEIVKYPSYGANYGTLSIPEVNIENKIYFGDMTTILSLGIGHTTSSSMPTEGDTVIYSGHNRENMLAGLKDIKKGNKITVDTTYAKCTYTVVKTEILNDTETGKLTKQNNKETLILYTCYPFGSYVYANKRFVVYSVLDNVEWK